jgi:hypothetical protein
MRPPPVSARRNGCAAPVNPPLTARDGGRDLAVCRAIDKAVFEMRVEISEACTKLADERNEPPLDDEP